MILADENLPESVIRALVAAGFEVTAWAELGRGAADETVLAFAVEHDLIVVTQDTDFGELVFRSGHAHVGVVLVRLHGCTFQEKAARVVALFRTSGEALRGAFTVVSNKGVRTRS